MKIPFAITSVGVVIFLLSESSSSAMYDWNMDLGLYAKYLQNPEFRLAGGRDYGTGEVGLNLEGRRASELRTTTISTNNLESRNTVSEALENNRNVFDISHQEMGERSILSLSGNYESTTTLAQTLISGDRANADVKQKNWNMEESVQYSMLQNLVVTFGAAQMRTTYDQVEKVFLSNFKNSQISGSAFYNQSEITKWGISFYEDTLTREKDLFVSTTKGVGLNYHSIISETLSAKTRLGYRMTQSGLKGYDSVIADKKYGRSINIDIKKTFVRSHVGLLFSDDLSPKFNGSLDQTQTSELYLTYRLSEHLTASGKLSSIQRDPINNFFQERKVRYGSAVAALKWSPFRRLTMEASYRYANQELPEANIDVDSEALVFGLRWQVQP